MGLINLIRIDSNSGILLADEEFWRRGSRRTLTLDNLHPLLPPEFCEDSSLEVVIGLAGDPSVTYECSLAAQRAVEEVIRNPAGNGRSRPIETVREVAAIAVRAIEQLIRKRINDQLGFTYGFNLDDLARGFFETGTGKVEIKQESIRSDALSWLKYNEKNPRTRHLFEISALIAGYDQAMGFNWFEWDGRNGTLFPGSGNFDCIGPGSDAANLAFIDIFRQRELKKRRKGMSTEEALFALMEALEAATRFNHEVGGYPQLVMIFGMEPDHAQRYREMSGHETKLAQEIVTACIHQYIARDTALKYLNMLFLQRKDVDAVEDLFFDGTQRRSPLDYFLRGYKSSVADPTGKEKS